MARHALAVLAVLALTAGCSSGGPSATGTAASAAPSASSPPAVPSGPSGAPAASGPRVIAGSALLQPEDLGGAALAPMQEGDNAHLRPLRPCDARYPTDATRSSAVAMQAQVVAAPGQTPSVLVQYVGLHPGAGPAAFAEIVAAVRGCPGSLDPGKLRWEVAATGVAGDESLLVRVGERFSYGDPSNVVTHVTPAALVRVGDHVTVVADLGWESASGDEALVRGLAAKAADRLRTAA